MKFLMRDIFLATFFVAVAALYFSSERKLLILNTRLASQEQQNAAARDMHSQLVAYRDFVQADIDCSIQVDSVATQLESHFPALQAKYSAIEARDDTTVSVRQIPMIIDRKTGIDLNRIRIHVPTDRTVYLKYGIRSHKAEEIALRKTKRFREDPPPATGQDASPDVATKREMHIDYNEDGFAVSETSECEMNDERGTDWQSITDYSEAGPFEYRLKSGPVDIDWSNHLNRQGLWEMHLFLNQQTLLTTVFEVKQKLNSYSTLLAKEQRDFTAGVRLPALFTSTRVNSKSSSSSTSAFQIHVWLDEKSSGFAVFPGAVELK